MDVDPAPPLMHATPPYPDHYQMARVMLTVVLWSGTFQVSCQFGPQTSRKVPAPSPVTSELFETMWNQSSCPTQDDFRVLGLNPDCSPEELRTAYKALVKKWHPDHFVEEDAAKFAAEEKIKAINAAYSRLTKGASRISCQTDTKPAPARGAFRQRDTSIHRKAPPGKEAAPSGRLWESIAATLRGFPANDCRLSVCHKRWLGLGALSLTLILLLLLWIDIPNLNLPDQEPTTITLARKPTSRPRSLNATKAKKTASVAGLTIPPPESYLLEQAPTNPSGNGRQPPAGLFSSDQNYFTLGSPAHDVIRIQGKPERINGRTWIYGLSDVSFRDGRVSGYNNFDATLRVTISPTTPAPTDQRPLSFAVGAHRDEVLHAQGTPTRIDGNKWYYGLSEVVFKNGVVVAFNNFFSTLKVSMKPKDGAQLDISARDFSIGSTQDQVLAVQGTPSSVQANLWSYELSDVWFQDGKVRMVSDFSHVLKFNPRD